MALAGIIALAVVLRVINLGNASLWNDELFSRYYYDLFGPRFLWTRGLSLESSPPLYYTVLAGWMTLFGTSEAALRALSVAASVLAIPPIYALGREIGGPRQGVWAALLFACAPLQIYFAQETRTYALLLPPLVLCMLAVACFLRTGRNRYLALYGVAAIVAIWCHVTMVFFVAACNVAVLVALHARPGSTLWRWLATNAMVGLATLPVLLGAAVQSRSNIGWIPPLSLYAVVWSLVPLVGGMVLDLKMPGIELAGLLVLLLAIGLWRHPPGRVASTVLLILPASFVAMLLLVSLHGSILLPRVVSWLDVPLVLLLAGVLANGSGGAVYRGAVLALTGAAFLIGMVAYYHDAQKEPWRQILQPIAPALARADRVILARNTGPTPLAYYTPRVGHIAMWDDPTNPDLIETLYLPAHFGVPRIDEASIVDAITRHQDIWLVARYPDLPDVARLLTQVPPPTNRSDAQCGRDICVAMLHWAP